MFTRPRCFKHPMVHFCSLKCKGFDFVNHHHRSVNRSYLGSRFFGEFLPAGEIWTNTSQWTKSTFPEKISQENIKKSKENIRKSQESIKRSQEIN